MSEQEAAYWAQVGSDSQVAPDARTFETAPGAAAADSRAPGYPVGKIIFWLFLATLGIILVMQYFEIQENCFRYMATDQWQKNLC